MNANFSDSSFRTFIIFFRQSRHLQELHLSGCDVSNVTFREFFEAIEKNRYLTYLNLSWNQLFGSSKDDESGLFLSNMIRFIKKNKQLLHIDLSHTQMSESQIKKLAE